MRLHVFDRRPQGPCTNGTYVVWSAELCRFSTGVGLRVTQRVGGNLVRNQSNEVDTL